MSSHSSSQLAPSAPGARRHNACRHRSAIAIIAILVALLICCSSAHAAPATAGAKITRTEVMERARHWYDSRDSLSYDSSRQADTLVADVDGAHRYGRDCSGFVSMAWHLDPGLYGGLNTRTLPEVTAPVGREALAPGDILDYPDKHVILFEAWEPDHVHFSYYSFGGTPIKHVEHASFGDPRLSGWDTGRYQALRYDGIVDDAPAEDRLHPGGGAPAEDGSPDRLHPGGDAPAEDGSEDRLDPDQQLHPGESRVSADGRYRFTLEAGGQLVLYEGDERRWTSPETNQHVDHAVMQSDGNLVLYANPGDDPRTAVWATGTDRGEPAFLLVQDDGNVVIYKDADGDGEGDSPLWATNTAEDGAAQQPGPQADAEHAEGASLPRYVSLGDSYSSGEGGGDYLREPAGRPAKCHRSAHAYSQLLAARLAGSYRHDPDADFLACSGEKADDEDHPEEPDLLSRQVPQLGADVGLVTLGIGGNDVGWGDMLVRCGLDAIMPPGPGTGKGCKQLLDHHLDAELPRLQRHLDAVYDEIKARAPGATVIVLGYPPLFEDSWASAACPSAALTRGERADLREGAERLDAAIKEVAERAGFRFVDPSAAFEDHRLCSSGAGWLNGITVERSGEDTGTCVREPELVDALLPPSDGDRSYACLSPGSFHPNVAGQAAFAEVIAATNPDIFR